MRVGTRESKLARLQTDIVIARLAKHYPDFDFEVDPSPPAVTKYRTGQLPQLADAAFL